MKHTQPKKHRVAPGLWQLKRNLFEIRVRVTDPRTGKHKARWQQFEGNRREAMMERERWRDDLLEELLHPGARETVASFATSWLATKLKRGDLAPSTARKYAEAIDIHVLPTFGEHRLEHLTTRDISAWLAAKAADDYAPSTCNSWLRAFATMLADAVSDGLLTHNPAVAVKALRQRDDVDDDNALHPNELRIYLETWKGLYPDFYPLVLSMALTGIRWGEATALKWSDIDEADKAGLLLIRRSHWCGQVKLPKTNKRRHVAYPAVLADVMKEHRQRSIAQQHPSLKGGWCFTATNGKLLRHGRLSAENKAVLTKAGITRRVTIHGLRRTMTDLLRLTAVDQVTAAAMIGHDTERMRTHYSTVRADEARAAGDKVTRLVFAQEVDGRTGGRSAKSRNDSGQPGNS